MPIMGGRIIRVEAKKKEENAIESFNMNFVIDAATASKGVLTIKYTSVTEYVPNVATITVEGEMYYEDQEKRVKELAEEYKKFRSDSKGKHPLPVEVLEEVLNGLNYSTQAVGTLAAFALNIAAPIQLPKTKVQPPSLTPPAGKGQAS